MKDIPIRFSDVIKDLNEVNVVFYTSVDDNIYEALVIKAQDGKGSIISPSGEIFDVEFNPNNGCWWLGDSKLHILVRNV